MPTTQQRRSKLPHPLIPPFQIHILLHEPTLPPALAKVVGAGVAGPNVQRPCVFRPHVEIHVGQAWLSAVRHALQDGQPLAGRAWHLCIQSQHIYAEWKVPQALDVGVTLCRANPAMVATGPVCSIDWAGDSAQRGDSGSASC